MCINSIRLMFVFVLFVYGSSAYAFVVHQLQKIVLKSGSNYISKGCARKLQGHSVLKRPLRRFFRFTSFPLKQLFPITFKRETVLFSTKVDIKSVLMGHIHQEQEKVAVAVYLITDRDIADALVFAHRRGAKVEVISDKKAAESRYSQIPYLIKNGVSVFLYFCAQCVWSIMHNKFVLFFSQKTLWNGSFNFTQSANKINRENVILMRNKAIFTQFNRIFDEIKNESKKD